MSGLILFILAVVFTICTSPIWLFLGFVWSLIVFVSKFVSYCFQVYTTFFANDNFFEGFFCSSFCSFYSTVGGFISFFSPLSIAWNFSRYEHPFWALLISLCLTIFYIFLLDKQKWDRKSLKDETIERKI